MKFFAVHISDLESEAFTIASADQVATWLFLHALCAKQMNSGRIEGAKRMPPKFWQRHGIEAPDILRQPSPLWEWEGDDLRLSPYDIEGERITSKKIEGGRKGGKARAAQRWRKNESAESSPSRTPKGTGGSSPDAPDPSSTQSELIEPEQTTPQSPQKGAMPAELVPIWEAYPATGRNRSTREKARRAWQRLSPRPDPAEVLRVLQLWKTEEQWTKDAGKFVPACDLWIKNRGWQDEPAQAERPVVDIGGRKPKTLSLDPPASR